MARKSNAAKSATANPPFAPPNWPAAQVEMWKLDKIKPYPNNPRTHPPEQIKLLARSMAESGVTMPILVDEAGVIIAGHGRLMAAQENAFEEYPVVVARGWTDTQKRAERMRDNQIGLLSGWDENALRLEVGDLKLEGYDLPLLGFNDFDLGQLMAVEQQLDNELDVIPPLPKNPITMQGDIWTLGNHRILCGDSRAVTDVDQLMNGAKINVAFTSPPYAEQRDYDEQSGFRPINPDEYVEWFNPVAANVARHLAADGSWFINIKPAANGLDTELYVFDLVLTHARKWGWHFATELCWERTGVPKSVTRRFKNQFEPIYQFTRGDWKMRPKAVMHPSNNVPIPGGPGVGQTSWKSAQGGNGPMFGAAAGRFNARPPGRRSGHPNDEKRQGKTDWNQGRRGRALGVGPTTASKLQGQPGAYTRDIKKRRKGFPTGEGSQGTDWQKGAPRGVHPDDIVAGMAYPGNRLPTFAGSHEATGHAAAFPVGLPGFFVLAYSDQGDAIYDPFLGSGSTLIAAEQHGRIGYGMELSPAYVDICVKRWQNFTGKQATLDGKTFEQVANERSNAKPKRKPASMGTARAGNGLSAGGLAAAAKP